MMAEIAMKARMLREKIRSNPGSISEVLESLKVLEADMFICLLEFEDSMAR